MAALTWRDVAAPSFGGVNQAYQGAAATMDRALAGLADGLKQFSTDQQAGVDNSILARSLAIQDPNQMREALATGKLLEGVDLTKVNPKVLEALSTRRGTLLNQASTEQGIASSKTSQAATQQNIDFGAQDQTRKTTQQQIEDAARPEQARQLGLTGALAALPTDQQRSVATTNSSLATAALGRDGQRISNATGAFNLDRGRRDDVANQAALSSTANALENNATVDDLRSSVLQIQNPQERMLATKAIEAQTGQRLFGTTDDVPTTGSSGGKGGAAVASAGASEASTPEARMALSEIGRRVAQNSSLGVVADIEKNKTDTRDPLTVASDLAKSIPNAKQGKIHEIISKAQSDYPGLSAADISSVIARSPASGGVGSTNIGSGDGVFGAGIGIDDAAFKANLEAMASGKADYMSTANQETVAVGKSILKADKAMADAKAELAKQQLRQQSQPGIDIGKAQRKADNAEFALKQLIQNQQASQALQPNYTKAPPRPAKEASDSLLQNLYESGRKKRSN